MDGREQRLLIHVESQARREKERIDRSLEQGRTEALREAVKRVLVARFGDLPESVTTSLDGVVEIDALDRLLTSAASAPDLAAFRTE